MKYSIPEGRLDRLLQERGLVRKNIQNESGMPRRKELLDKKTVITISKGREASRNSFEKLANILEISLDELVPALSKEIKYLHFDPKPNRFIPAEIAQANTTFLNKINNAPKLLFKLDLTEMNDRQKQAIDGFDHIVQKVKNTEAVYSDLSSQIEQYSIISDIKKVFDKLSGTGLTVYVAEVEFWETSEQDIYQSFYIKYNSTKILLIGITEPRMEVTFRYNGGLPYTPSLSFLSKNFNTLFEKGWMFNDPYTAAYINGQGYNKWEIKAASHDDYEYLLKDPTDYYEELDHADYEEDANYPD